jgi:ribosomal protein L24E
VAGARRRTREDGADYVTKVVASAVCEYCGNLLVVHAEGRPPRFCGSGCRSGAFRRSKVTKRLKLGTGVTQGK